MKKIKQPKTWPATSCLSNFMDCLLFKTRLNRPFNPELVDRETKEAEEEMDESDRYTEEYWEQAYRWGEPAEK